MMHLRKRGKRRLIALVSVVLIAAAGLFVFKVVGKSQQQKLFETARIQGLASYAQRDYESTLDNLKYCVQYDKRDIEVLLAFADARKNLPLSNNRHLHESVTYYDYVLGLLVNETAPPNTNGHKLEALEALLILREDLGHRFELLEVAEQLLEFESNHVLALRAKVAALFSDRQFDEASPILDRLIALEPVKLKWRSWKLQLLRLQGSSKEQLLSQCDKWIIEQPDNTQFRLIKAQQLAQFGHHTEAKSEAELVVENGVTSLAELQSLIVLLDSLGGHDIASKAIVHAKRQFPKEMWVREAAVRRLWRNGQIDLALREIADTESVLGDLNPYMLRLKVSVLLANADADEARIILHKLLRIDLNESDADAHRSWARAVEMNVNGASSSAQEQIEQLHKAAIDNPNDAILVLMLAGIYADQGELTRSLQAYSEAYSLDRFWLQASAGYTRALLDAGKVQEAFIVANDLYALAPPSLIEPYILFAESYLALHQMGNIPVVTLRSTGERFDVVGLLEKLHERAPDELPVASLLCEAYIAFDMKPKAIELIREKIISSDIDPAVLLSLAKTSKRYELDFEQTLLQKARQLDSNNLEVILSHARVIADTGNIDSAKSLIDSSIHTLGPKVISSKAWRVGHVKFLLHIQDPSSQSQLALLVDEFSQEPSVQSFVLAQNITWDKPKLVEKAITNIKSVLGSNSHQVRLAMASQIIRYNADDEAQLAEAIAILARVLEQSPESLAALSLLAEAYMHTAPPSLKQVVDYLKKAIDIYPMHSSLYPRLITLLQQQGEYQDAALYLNRFSELASHDLGLLRVEINLLTAQGNFNSAVARASVLAQSSSLVGDQLQLASLCQRTGRLPEAQEIYDTLLTIPQPNSIVIVKAADYYASINKGSKAEALMQMLSKNNATAATAALTGRYYQRHGEFQLSEQWLTKALKMDPDLVDAWQALTRTYLASNKFTSAYEAASDGLKLSPNHHGLQGLFAVSVMKQDIHGIDRAIEQLNEIDVPAQNLVATLNLLKEIRQVGDESQPSAVHLQSAQNLIDDHATFLPAWLLAISINEKAGEFSNAAELSRKASKRFPSRSEPAQWATKLLMRIQRWDEALWEAKEWRNRSFIDPSSADIASARILLELGRYADAVDNMRPYAKTIIAQREKYPDQLFLWVRLLVLDGRIDEAYIITKPLLQDNKWCGFWLSLIQIMDPVDAESALRLTETSLLTDNEFVLQLAAAWSDLGARIGDTRMQLEAERLIADSKDSLSAQLIQGRIAEAREEWATAEAIYRDIIAGDKNNLAALNNLAFVLCHSANTNKEALKFAERALLLAPDHPDILDTYALILIGFKRFSAAQEVLIHAHNQRPDDNAISLSLAETTLKMGQIDEAWLLLQDIERKLSFGLSIDPKLQNRANILRNLINQAQASAEVPIGQ